MLSCTNQKPVNVVDKNALPNVKALFSNLQKNVAANKIMFGHQDDLGYGVNWRFENGRSDVKESCGSFPAVYGWDVSHIELDSICEIDGIPFDKLRQFMIDVYLRGGINTCSWHVTNPVTHKSAWDDTKEKNPTVSKIIPGGSNHADYIKYLDKVANFFLSLKTPKGEMVPIIFRPFHENSGNWFWWGKVHCTPDEYIKLYRFTVDYLTKTKNVHNLLFAYSPDIGYKTETDYLERYPGNDYVDIIGVDDYEDFKKDDFLNLVSDRLTIIAKFAKANNKISAMTETGNEMLKDSVWFTTKLLPCLKANEFTKRTAWVMVWRNARLTHFYAPFAGHSSVNDFKKFKADSLILFEDNLPKMYDN